MGKKIIHVFYLTETSEIEGSKLDIKGLMVKWFRFQSLLAHSSNKKVEDWHKIG